MEARQKKVLTQPTGASVHREESETAWSIEMITRPKVCAENECGRLNKERVYGGLTVCGAVLNLNDRERNFVRKNQRIEARARW